jgi:hypothetical protein
MTSSASRKQGKGAPSLPRRSIPALFEVAPLVVFSNQGKSILIMGGQMRRPRWGQIRLPKARVQLSSRFKPFLLRKHFSPTASSQSSGATQRPKCSSVDPSQCHRSEAGQDRRRLLWHLHVYQ